MTSIIEEITKTCTRTDCQLAFDGFGISNNAGYTSGVTCYSCKREWSVHQPARYGPELYDRDGKLLNPKLPPIIKVRPPR